MKIFTLLGIALMSFQSIAAPSTLSCFGYHGPTATAETGFFKDIDVTNDFNDPQAFLKTYSIISHNDFQIDVVLNFPQRRLSLNITKEKITSMSVGSFEGAQLVLTNAKTNQPIVYVECGVVTKAN